MGTVSVAVFQRPDHQADNARALADRGVGMGALLVSIAWLIAERPADAAAALSAFGARLWRLFEDHVQPHLVRDRTVRRHADALEARYRRNAFTIACLNEDRAEEQARNLERILWFRVAQELRRRNRERRHARGAITAPHPPFPRLDSPPTPALYPSRLAGADPPQPGAE